MSYFIRNLNKPRDPRWSDTISEYIGTSVQALVRDGTGRNDIIWKTTGFIDGQTQLFRYGTSRNSIRYENTIFDMSHMSIFVGHRFLLYPYLFVDGNNIYCSPSPSLNPKLASVDSKNKRLTFDQAYRCNNGSGRYTLSGTKRIIQFDSAVTESSDVQYPCNRILNAHFNNYQYTYLGSIKLKITGSGSSSQYYCDIVSGNPSNTSYNYIQFSNS